MSGLAYSGWGFIHPDCRMSPAKWICARLVTLSLSRPLARKAGGSCKKVAMYRDVGPVSNLGHSVRAVLLLPAEQTPQTGTRGLVPRKGRAETQLVLKECFCKAETTKLFIGRASGSLCRDLAGSRDPKEKWNLAGARRVVWPRGNIGQHRATSGNIWQHRFFWAWSGLQPPAHIDPYCSL